MEAGAKRAEGPETADILGSLQVDKPLTSIQSSSALDGGHNRQMMLDEQAALMGADLEEQGVENAILNVISDDFVRNAMIPGGQLHLSMKNFAKRHHSATASVFHTSNPITVILSMRWCLALGMVMCISMGYSSIRQIAIIQNVGQADVMACTFTNLESRDSTIKPTSPQLSHFGMLHATGPCPMEQDDVVVSTNGTSTSIFYHQKRKIGGWFLVTQFGDTLMDPVRFEVHCTDDALAPRDQWFLYGSSSTRILNGRRQFLVNKFDTPLQRHYMVEFDMRADVPVILDQTVSPSLKALGYLGGIMMGVTKRPHLGVWFLAMGWLVCFPIMAAAMLIEFLERSHWRLAVYYLLQALGQGAIGMCLLVAEMWFAELFIMGGFYYFVLSMIQHNVLFKSVSGDAMLEDFFFYMFYIVIGLFFTFVRMRVVRINRDLVLPDEQLYDAAWQRITQEKANTASLAHLKNLTQMFGVDEANSKVVRQLNRHRDEFSHHFDMVRKGGHGSQDSFGSDAVRTVQRIHASVPASIDASAPVTSLDQLYAQASAADLLLQVKVKQWALGSRGSFLLTADGQGSTPKFVLWEHACKDAKLRARLDCGSIKRVARSIDKLLMNYDQDVSRLTDICRKRIVFDEINDMCQCLSLIAQDDGVCVERIKNTMDMSRSARMNGGFRAVTINLRITSEKAVTLAVETHICELQLCLKQISLLNTHAAHERYLTFRNTRDYYRFEWPVLSLILNVPVLRGNRVFPAPPEMRRDDEGQNNWESGEGADENKEASQASTTDALNDSQVEEITCVGNGAHTQTSTGKHGDIVVSSDFSGACLDWGPANRRNSLIAEGGPGRACMPQLSEAVKRVLRARFVISAVSPAGALDLNKGRLSLAIGRASDESVLFTSYPVAAAVTKWKFRLIAAIAGIVFLMNAIKASVGIQQPRIKHLRFTALTHRGGQEAQSPGVDGIGLIRRDGCVNVFATRQTVVGDTRQEEYFKDSRRMHEQEDGLVYSEADALRSLRARVVAGHTGRRQRTHNDTGSLLQQHFSLYNDEGFNASVREEGASFYLSLQSLVQFDNWLVVTSLNSTDLDASRFLLHGKTSDDGSWILLSGSGVRMDSTGCRYIFPGAMQLPEARNEVVRIDTELTWLFVTSGASTRFVMACMMLTVSILGSLSREHLAKPVIVFCVVVNACIEAVTSCILLGTGYTAQAAAGFLSLAGPIFALYVFGFGNHWFVNGIIAVGTVDIISHLLRSGLIYHDIEYTKAYPPVLGCVVIGMGICLHMLRKFALRTSLQLVAPDKAAYDKEWDNLLQSQEGKDYLGHLAVIVKMMGHDGTEQSRQYNRKRMSKAMSLHQPATLHKVPRTRSSAWARYLNHVTIPGTIDMKSPVVSLDQLYAQAAVANVALIAKVKQWAKVSNGSFLLQRTNSSSSDISAEHLQSTLFRSSSFGKLDERRGPPAFILWSQAEADPALAARIKFGQLKSLERACEKLSRSYHEQVSLLVDLCRQSIYFDNAVDLTRCLGSIASDEQVSIVRIKNRLDMEYNSAVSAGYRDVALNLRLTTHETLAVAVETHVCELQLVLKTFASLKDDEGHRRYIQYRNVRGE